MQNRVFVAVRSGLSGTFAVAADDLDFVGLDGLLVVSDSGEGSL